MMSGERPLWDKHAQDVPGKVVMKHELKRLMLFPGAVGRDSAVDAGFWARSPELGAIALEWFTRMRECGADVLELLHDGHPTACVGEAAFAYTNAFTSHVNVGFFHGSTLADPARLVQGTGKYMRHVKLMPGIATDVPALGALISAAYLDMKAYKRANEAAGGA